MTETAAPAPVLRALERARTVTGPDGGQWTVRRILLPREDSRPGPGGEDPPRPGTAEWYRRVDGVDVSLFDGDARALLFIVGASLIGFILLAPLLPLLADIIVITVGALAGITGRLLFRRPWRIEATPARPAEGPGGGPVNGPADGPADAVTPGRRWGIVGTRASAAAVDAVADALTAGRSLDAVIVGVAL